MMSTKRLLREHRDVRKRPEPGIHFYVDDSNMAVAQVLVIPRADQSRIFGGAMLQFEIKCPSTYPMDPPKVQFLTPRGRGEERIHPNLYGSGKVCLSIINTWAEKQWSPTYTWQKIFVQVLALLDDNPLTYEPGQERHSATSTQAVSYARASLHRVLRVCVVGFMNEVRGSSPVIAEPLRKAALAGFLAFKDDYLERARTLLPLQGKSVTCFHGSVVIDAKSIIRDLEDLIAWAVSEDVDQEDIEKAKRDAGLAKEEPKKDDEANNNTTNNTNTNNNNNSETGKKEKGTEKKKTGDEKADKKADNESAATSPGKTGKGNADEKGENESENQGGSPGSLKGKETGQKEEKAGKSANVIDLDDDDDDDEDGDDVVIIEEAKGKGKRAAADAPAPPTRASKRKR